MIGYKSFLLSYFENCQIWLHILINDRHLRSIITKLGGGGKNTGIHHLQKEKIDPIDLLIQTCNRFSSSPSSSVFVVHLVLVPPPSISY
jgi:hypothetical protein